MTVLRRVMAFSALGLLTACGGGGGGAISTPSPAPSPTPTPTPSPTPTPTTPPAAQFQTAEYNESDGPAIHNAIPAWQRGATGQNVTIAIIDSGIDSDSPEFAGRIASASTDLVGTRGIDNPDSDHGTRVALVAAAARNNSGIMGIAWGANVLALRADRPGSCLEQGEPLGSGCKFEDGVIATGVDRAVANGARVINLSLGGEPPTADLQAAIARAATAGVVVVVSAGNQGASTEAGVDPNNPDPFAAGIRAAGNANVIIAGSINSRSEFSAFSNRAGAEQQWFLSAQGEGVCCVYKDGEIQVTVGANGVPYFSLFSGTSFSAPQIAGAVALVRQAFPNMTAAQVVDLLLSTARDAGASGTDGVFGRGILDIGRAFQPQGTTSLAGSTMAVPLSGTILSGSAAMGDALAPSSGQPTLSAVVLDRYQRAFSFDLAGGLAAAGVMPRLGAALAGQARTVSGGAGPIAMAFSVARTGLAGSRALPLRLPGADAQRARVLAGRVLARIAPGTTLGFAYRQGADGLVAQLQGQQRAAFLVAGDPADDGGFVREAGMAVGWRQQVGNWGLTVSADRAQVARTSPGLRGRVPDLASREAIVRRAGVAIDRTTGPVLVSLGLGWQAEDRTILGARMLDGLGGGADSLFLDLAGRWQIGPAWQLGAAWREGRTRLRRGGIVAGGAAIASNGWAVDLTRAGVFAADDALSLRLSQPLRVSRGHLDLTLPVAWDYATARAATSVRAVSLAPRGRELTGEIAWRGGVLGGTAVASLFYRRNPGHFAAVSADAGAGLAWSAEF